MPEHYRAPGVVEAVELTLVVPETDGRVEKILAEPGTSVRRGDPLVELSDPEIALHLTATEAQKEETLAMRQNVLAQNIEEIKPIDSRLEAIETQLRRLEQQQKALILRAAHDGTWYAPDLPHWLHSWVMRGTELGQIVNEKAFRFSAVVSENDASRLFEGRVRPAEVRLYGQAGLPLKVVGQRIIPAEQDILPSAALGWRGGGDVAVSADGSRRDSYSRAFLCRASNAGAAAGCAVESWLDRQNPLRAATAAAAFPVGQAFLPVAAKTLRLVMTATDEYRRCAVSEPPELTEGLDRTVESWIGLARRHGGVLRRLYGQAEEAAALEQTFAALDGNSLATCLSNLRMAFRRETPERPAPLAEGLAAVAEIAARTLGMRPRLVQLVGAVALHRGYLAEMATGEGKSLTAALSGVLAGWSGRPCHIVTVNDYLAERDAREFLPLYGGCGLRPGFVVGTMDPAARRNGHAADVTYTTSKELLADFLRDRLCLGENQSPARWMVRQLQHPDSEAHRGRSGDAGSPPRDYR